MDPRHRYYPTLAIRSRQTFVVLRLLVPLQTMLGRLDPRQHERIGHQVEDRLERAAERDMILSRHVDLAVRLRPRRVLVGPDGWVSRHRGRRARVVRVHSR